MSKSGLLTLQRLRNRRASILSQRNRCQYIIISISVSISRRVELLPAFFASQLLETRFLGRD
ncbi:hypothetical protein WT49_20060 [Burkholderia territorii]|nr:hypothetical protein WT49_20060 [Burkholderia territorii]KWE34916.1 hypothetical protein WT50_26030 [Burkholderia territorii]KWE47272.1 hypothetical protein WT51_16195 [Burkholderia territorii]